MPLGKSLIPTTLLNHKNDTTKPSLKFFIEENQSIDDDKCNYKDDTLATTFHVPKWKTKLYVCYIYVPQKIFNHTQRKNSGSMNADLVNAIYTSQQSTKIGLREQLEGYFFNEEKQ